MEPESSLPGSQEPSAGPYPDPNRSSPYHPILSLLRSISILSIHLRLGVSLYTCTNTGARGNLVR
jgi:hypothetical protein